MFWDDPDVRLAFRVTRIFTYRWFFLCVALFQLKLPPFHRRRRCPGPRNIFGLCVKARRISEAECKRNKVTKTVPDSEVFAAMKDCLPAYNYRLENTSHGLTIIFNQSKETEYGFGNHLAQYFQVCGQPHIRWLSCTRLGASASPNDGCPHLSNQRER